MSGGREGETDATEWSAADRAAGVIRGIRFATSRPVHAAENVDARNTLCGRAVPNDAHAVLLVWRNESDRCRTCQAKAEWLFGAPGNGPLRPSSTVAQPLATSDRAQEHHRGRDHVSGGREEVVAEALADDTEDDYCMCVLYKGRHLKQGGRCPQYAMGAAYAKWTKGGRKQ